MKNGLLLLGCIWGLCANGQNGIYKGSFTGAESNETVSTNMVILKIEGNDFNISYHLRMHSAFQVLRDKKDHSGDFTDLSGSCNGVLSGNDLNGSCKILVEENDAGSYTKNQPPGRISAVIGDNEINGKLLVGTEEPTELAFKLKPAGSDKPELTYPAGRSPKVFDKGWVFGASFVLTDDNGKTIDLSDKVEWSGTASFQPAMGNESRPAFNNIGTNKIILTVNYEGKTYRNEFSIETVSGLLYGHKGTMVLCNADLHGCIACPHNAPGSVVTGTELVMADGYPAARVGDRGVTFGCCGENTFVITRGDERVLIQGIPAAKIGSETKHCGGIGNLIGGYWDYYLWYNKCVQFISSGKEEGNKSELLTGDKVQTSENGFLGFFGNSTTAVSLFPNSLLSVLQQTKEQLILALEKGSIMVNGHTNEGKKISLQLKKLSIRPTGTKFLVTADSLGNATIHCYEGQLQITTIADGNSSTIDSGYVYTYTGSAGSVRSPDSSDYLKTMHQLMSVVDSKSMKIYSNENSKKENMTEIKSSEGFFGKYKYLIIAGAILLLGILVAMLRNKQK